MKKKAFWHSVLLVAIASVGLDNCALSGDTTDAGDREDELASDSADAVDDADETTADSADAGDDADEATADSADAGDDTDESADVGDSCVDAGPPPDAGWIAPPWYSCRQSDLPPEATVVVAMDKVHQCFGGGANTRSVDVEVDFPSEGCWSQVGMQLTLSCPAGGCDPWDRFANIALVENPGGQDPQVIELERYMTPYRVGMCFHSDVTWLAPRLRGKKTLRSVIDTWVNPGWAVTVKFIFRPGTPETDLVPEQLLPLWEPKDVEVGNPENTSAQQLGATTVAIPDWVTRAEIRMLTTGHGQGNTSNCAEFCKLNQVIDIDGQQVSHLLWRDNCSSNPVSNQSGTWRYNRAGWCPGAYVVPTVIDITSKITPGQDARFEYRVLGESMGEYVNTCRPTASPCGCSDCSYNNQGHTMPVEKVSAQLLLYR